MNRLVPGQCVRLSVGALWALALVTGGCAASTVGSNGSGGGSGAGMNGTGTGQGGASTSGTGGGAAGVTGTGGTGAGGTGPTTSGTGGSGAGGGIAGSSGTGGGSAGTSGGVARTTELIGPGAATCGATNATHGDGFICVLPYPNPGTNVVGYWFDYAFTAGTCNVAFTKPAGNNATNPQVCFSGSACPATSGGGLGLALCDTHGIDVSTWPELKMLETTSSLSATAKSPFSGCNPGGTITSVSWTLGSGSIPAGTSVLLDDAADVNVTRIDNVAAGATSVAVPANVDTSKVASIKFSVNGASSASWNFCLTSLKVSSH